MEFKVIPNKSIGPAQLGMSREQIRKVMGEPSAVQDAYEKWGIHFPNKDFFYKNAFQVSYDKEMKAEFIEVSAESDYVVTFDGLPIHESSPEIVISTISKYGEVDKTEKEYPINLWFPSLNINLYREHSADDKFDTVGVCTPAYSQNNG